MTMEENVNDFFKLISDLENVKVTVPDEDKAIVLLMSLPKQFDQLKETLKYGKTSLALERNHWSYKVEKSRTWSEW